MVALTTMRRRAAAAAVALAWALMSASSCSALLLSRLQLLRASKAGIVASMCALGLGDTADADDSSSYIVDKRYNKVYFYGEVDTSSCLSLRRTLSEAATESRMTQMAFGLQDPPPIELHIQSYGGEVLPAMGVVDYIEQCGVPVHSYIDGYAASAATMISVACKRRYAYRNSIMLLHQISGGARGKMAEMDDQFSNMKALMAAVVGLYTRRTFISAEELDELLRHDLWLNAEECLSHGIVDAIV